MTRKISFIISRLDVIAQELRPQRSPVLELNKQLAQYEDRMRDWEILISRRPSLKIQSILAALIEDSAKDRTGPGPAQEILCDGLF
jgi:hypothetical protein